MISFRKLIALIVIFSMTFSSIACTTMKPISLTEPANFAQIKAGDVISYKTDSETVEKLKVTSVNSEMIQGTSKGQDKMVMISAIKHIEKKEISARDTTVAVVLIVAVVGGLVALLMQAAASPYTNF